MKARIMSITMIVALTAIAACAVFAAAADDPVAPPAHTNRLAKSTSPYLLQHAHNPVDWYEWGDEAFDAARKQDKPIFLSVGYSTCHWCHVMAHESFEDEAVAKMLNDRFICIKVDREQLPDVDEQYMLATQLFTQRGGWPNSVFLTPDRRPWFAGTYYPKPQFMQLLDRLADAWANQREAVDKQADQFAAAIRQAGGAGLGERAPLDAAIVDRAARYFLSVYDKTNGGFGGGPGAPKFPPHGALRVLFAHQKTSRDIAELNAIAHTLDAMHAGGLYDHVGGGFHRYSTDARWFLPHFEKMLYDNAQLVVNYTDGWLYTQDDAYRRVIDETFNWLTREMTDPSGGFYSALDADSEGEEGKCYLWSHAELLDVLGDADGALFAEVYGATQDGTYYEEATRHRPGTNVLYLPKPIADVAKAKSLDAAELGKRLAAMRAKLLAVRVKRVPPHLDDKVLASWNGLMIGALAYAGRMTEDARYTKAAAHAADFVLTNMRDADGRLARAWRKGQSTGHGYLDDYAYMTRGLLELHEATGEAKWLDAARQLADRMIADFYDDAAGGFFVTAASHDELLLRSKGLGGGGNQPMANGVAAESLVRLAAATKDDRYLPPAAATFAAFSGMMTRQPHSTESLVAALPMLLDAAGRNPKLLADATGRDPDADAFAGAGAVTVNAYASTLTAKPGDTVKIALRLRVAPNHHIYAPADGVKDVLPTTLRLEPGSPVTLGDIAWPAAKTVHDPVLDKDIATYEGEVTVIATLKIAADAKPGESTVTLIVRAQACDDKLCLPPEDYALPITLTIDPNAQPAPPRHADLFR